MSVSTTIVFGAGDPEREAAIALATDSGLSIHYATFQGQPCHAGTAYKADGIDPPLPADVTSVLRFECDGPVFAGLDDKIVVIDHHRPGDPGYGRPPAEFLAASSIGQMIAYLAKEGKLPRKWKITTETPVGWTTRRGWNYDHNGLARAGPVSEWVYRPPNIPTVCVGLPAYVSWHGTVVPKEIVFAAAGDHCLPHAYRGECPGVKPDRLMEWRARSRAAFQGRPVEAVLADISAARKRLRDAVRPVDRFGQDPTWSGYPALTPEYADLGGEHIPELPEAAAREGIPFISEGLERDGRKKVVLQSAPTSLVERFLAGEIAPGLIDMYGDPARGFAGGYIA